MPYRRLPISDDQRKMALLTAKQMNDSLPEGTVVLSEVVADRLNDFQPDFNAKVTLRDVAKFNQTAATNDLNNKREQARINISQFIQSFNSGVARGYFPAQARNFYHLEVSSAAVPDISSDEKLQLWGDNIITGDPLRVAAGGAAMAMPTIVQFAAAFNPFVAAKISQRGLKEAFDQAQETVSAMRPDADSLILRIWNEVEAYYSEGDIESKRRHARNWGVVYVNQPGEVSLTGFITDTNSIPVEGTEVKIEQLMLSAYSNASGEYIFGAVAAGTYTLTASKAGFQSKTVLGIVINAAQTTNLNMELIATTGSLKANVIANGQPLEGASVMIDLLGLSVITGQDGSGTINGITPGAYVVTVMKNDYTTQNLSGIVISGGGTTTITVELVPTTGTLITNVISQGLPLEGATVSIEALGLQVVTGLTGEGIIQGIVPGTWNVSATAPGKIAKVLILNISANMTVSLTFDLLNA